MAVCEKYGKEIEKKWQEWWEKNKVYEFREDDYSKPIYSIDTPPPFTSGELHMGHVLSYSYFDFVARYKRMNGYNVYYPQGWDCQGFPTETKVEQKYGRRPPEEFRKLCIAWTEEFISKMKSQMKALGFSADWRYEYRTMDPAYHKKVQISILEMYKKGQIYRAEHPVFWCPHCVSALAKTDTEDAERETDLHYIKFYLEDGKPLLVATTRPELLHACVAVLYHPADERYSILKDKKIKTPLGKTVPLLADADVEKEFGSGLVMVCTFGDMQDVVWAYRHKLPVIRAIDEKGRIINSDGLWLDGSDIQSARAKTLERLKAENKYEKAVKIKQTIKVHDRCKKPIELLLSMQWFAKIIDKSDYIIESARKIRWTPSFGIQYLIDWAKFVGWDWVISRQRVFGTPLPFWIDSKTGKIYPAEENELPFDPIKHRTKKGPNGEELVAEQSTCDCWVDSSITPLIIARWKDDEEFFRRIYPVSLRPQGVEIVRTWAFYTIYRCTVLTGMPPFKDILLNGNVLAPDGKKMSKSLGNIIAPDRLIDEYSADAVRQWAALAGAMAKDRPFSYQDVQYAKNFITKLLNAAKLVQKACENKTMQDSTPSALQITDRWILSRLQKVKREVTNDYENFEFHSALNKVQDFFWHEFCDFYLEYTKHRIYQPETYGKESKQAAQHTMQTVLLECCQLIAPIAPHITEEIWQAFHPEKTIHLSAWPKVKEELIDDDAEKKVEALNKIISEVRQWKAKRRLPLNAEIERIKIRSRVDIQQVLGELQATGKIKNIEYLQDSQEKVEFE
ncbi:MAG: valine--tRNA ligase [Candidatus Micrarchaeota archaeon]|nr:valine--tRNA ligase [Candidatus Micrarchaeota archaeon]